MPKSIKEFEAEIATLIQLCKDAADGPDLIPLFKTIGPDSTPLKPAGLGLRIDELTTSAANYAYGLRAQILRTGGKPPYLAALGAFQNSLGILAAQIEGELRR